MEDGEAVKKKKTKPNIPAIIGIFLILVALVLIVVFLMEGETIVTGGFPDQESAVSTTCASTSIEYPIFTLNDAARKKLEIKVVANGDKVSTIGLVNQLYYSSEEAIRNSEAVNHFAMNKSFEDDGMKPDDLGATYMKLSDNLKMSLFAQGVDLDQTSLKYFLLNDVEMKDELKYGAVKKAYQSLGFSCVENKNS